jgi:hypothetical protein
VAYLNKKSLKKDFSTLVLFFSRVIFRTFLQIQLARLASAEYDEDMFGSLSAELTLLFYNFWLGCTLFIRWDLDRK